jgi:hypothetical protein
MCGKPHTKSADTDRSHYLELLARLGAFLHSLP